MIKTTVSVLFIVLLTISGLSVNGQPRDLPVYEVWRSATPIKIDGKLDDAVWAKAPLFPDFVMNLDGSVGSYKTEARMLYDDSFVYFAFRCLDDNIWATFKKRDQHLWDEEAVEVFLQADPQQPSYIELEVNPLGTMLDIYLLDIRKPLHYESWNSQKLKWAVQVMGTVDGKNDDKEWTCEIALPMEDIVTAKNLPPRSGDRWRLNLYRVENRPTTALLAWSPTLKDDFHLPRMFGEIVFSNQVIR
jgi:cellulose/xylan binding protein with CBM9 domain